MLTDDTHNCTEIVKDGVVMQNDLNAKYMHRYAQTLGMDTHTHTPMHKPTHTVTYIAAILV